MNGEFFSSPMFPNIDDSSNDTNIIEENKASDDNLYDLTAINGKKAFVYVSDNKERFEGILKGFMNDYVTLLDTKNNVITLLKQDYINYIEIPKSGK